MTDFYSVLQRAVASLPDGSGPQRRAVYDKARKALLKQLQSFDPPLPSAEVTAQRLALEDAIRKIENEIARQIRTRRAVQTAIPAPGAARSGAVAGGESEAEREARRRAEAQRQREQAAELLKSAVSTATLTPDPAPADASLPVPVTRAPEPQRPREELHHDADNGGDEDEVLFEHEPEPAELPGRRVGARGRRAEPSFDTAETVEAEYDEVEEAETVDANEEPAAAAQSRREEKRRQREEERRLKAERRTAARESRAARRPAGEKRRREAGKRSAAARILLPMIILVALAGAVYAAVTQREIILAAIDRLDGGSAGEVQPGRAPIGAPADGPVVIKNDERLPSATVDGEETRTVRTTAWPPRAEGDPAAVDTPAAPAGGETAAEDALPDAEAAARFAGEEEASPVEEQVAAVDSTATDAPADAAPEATPSVPAPSAPVEDFEGTGRQTAVLYEEAAQAGEAGSVIAGGVEWSMQRESVGGGDPEPVVRAVATVPDRSLNATVQIRENRDDALPASHLIEISFEVPEGFAGGGIKSVPGLIMKETEQSRGDALRGAAARVSNGLFWIALSEDPTDRATNLRLLRERDWIDIPILYENDRRAILTLRKGNDGFRSVNAAIQAWSPG
jgi:hypothetical protein